MRILYVTRHFNHSGYKILESLIANGIHIEAVLLRKEFSWFKVPVLHHLARALYRAECLYYRCRPLKDTRSEELLARRAGLRRISIESMRDEKFVSRLEALKPDLIMLGGGWHELIPDTVFRLPRYGCINTHPSLLPDFRGTSITRWQILHGAEKSGVTIHYVDGSFDTGRIIAQASLDVSETATPQDLFEQLGALGAALMPVVLREIDAAGDQHEVAGFPQQRHGEYFKRWRWDADGLRIDWSKPLIDIHNFVRANTQESYKYLGPYFAAGSNQYFLRETALWDGVRDRGYPAKHGLFVATDRSGAFVLTREGESRSLAILRIQRFDRRYYLRRSYKPGEILNAGELFHARGICE